MIVASHHVTRQREVQKHATELVERDLTEIHLDAAQMGVGGVHSWGARPDAEVMMPPNHRYRVSFNLRPLDAPVVAGRAVGAAGAADGAAASPLTSAASLRELASIAAEADGVDAAGAFRCAFPGDCLLYTSPSPRDS